MNTLYNLRTISSVPTAYIKALLQTGLDHLFLNYFQLIIHNKTPVRHYSVLILSDNYSLSLNTAPRM